jgi:hypothetical protein
MTQLLCALQNLALSSMSNIETRFLQPRQYSGEPAAFAGFGRHPNSSERALKEVGHAFKARRRDDGLDLFGK